MKTSKIFLFASCTAIVTLGGTAAIAQSGISGGSITIADSMAVETLDPIGVRQTDIVTTQLGGAIAASGVIGISGRPNQAFGVRLSQQQFGQDAPTFENLTAWSDNAGRNITAGQLARTDANGRDVLRLAGKLHLPTRYDARKTIASIMLGIDYQ